MMLPIKILFILISLFSFSLSIDQQHDIKVSENAKSKSWVVLVAGSKGYCNYRHQADVLHAYQLVQRIHKIPKERIILMMYDDIAYHSLNPVQGNIINYPNGDNLYTDDIQKDYVGWDVTPDNFIGVLIGDKKLIDLNKKVLNSTSEDNVFIYFSGHGGRRMIGFPDDVLFATELNYALEILKESKAFKKLVLYIEACESGSLFEGDLDPGNDIYAMTAASPKERSHAVFPDEKRKTFLADEFSIAWILDSFSVDSDNTDETLKDQYQHTKNKTLLSHVSQYGDLKMAEEDTISEFQGKKQFESNIEIKVPEFTDEQMSPMRSDEVEFYLTKIHSEMKKDNSFELLVQGRRIIDRFIDDLRIRFAKKLGVDKFALVGQNKIKNRACYDELITHLHENCAALHVHTYLLRHLGLFVNTCNVLKEMNIDLEISDVNAIISEECSSLQISPIMQMTKVV